MSTSRMPEAESPGTLAIIDDGLALRTDKARKRPPAMCGTAPVSATVNCTSLANKAVNAGPTPL